MNHAVVSHAVLDHWKSKLFLAALCVAVGPLARGQAAPADAPKSTPTPATAPAPADRAYLGVYIGTENDGGGVKLEKVVDGSPAAKAGLQSGDVITALGDRTVGNEEELREVIASHQVGEKLKVTFLRDGEKRRTSARLGKAPAEVEGEQGEEHEAPAIVEKPAKRTAPPQAEKAPSKVEVGTSIGGGGSGGTGFLGVSPSQDDQGRTTVSVLPGTPAEKAGLKNGDVILSVDATEVGSFDDLVKAMSSHHPGDKVTVVVERDGAKQKIKVKLGTRDAAMAGVGGGEGHGLGGAIAVPATPAPPAAADAPAAPAKPAKMRGRVAAPATAEASNSDSMKKEFDELRAQLESTRREMEDLRRKCESQQRTIEAIRRALGGGGEPGSTSMATSDSTPGGDASAVVSIPVASGSMGTSEVSFTAPAECSASSDGGSCCAAAGEGQAVAATKVDGGGGQIVLSTGEGEGQPIVLTLDGHDGVYSVHPAHAGKGAPAKTTSLGGQIELKLGDDLAKQLHGKLLGGGHAMTLKPTGTDGTFQVVLGSGDGDEKGAGAFEVVASDDKSADCCEESGEKGEHTIVLQLGDDHHGGGGRIVHQAMVGGAAPKHAMKAIHVSPESKQVFVIEDNDEAGDGKNGGEGCCCGECCSSHPQAAAKAHGGMGVMRRSGGGPPAGMNPPMRARVQRFGGMPGAPQGAMPRMGPGGREPQQLFKMLGGGGGFTWKCDGPCEFKFGPGGAELHCEGACEITRSGGSNEEAAQPGMPGMFQMLGAGEGDEDSESADDDDSGPREDGDDDDDDDRSPQQIGNVVRAF